MNRLNLKCLIGLSVLCMLSGVANAQNMQTGLVTYIAGVDPYCAADGYPNLGAVGDNAPEKCTRVGNINSLEVPGGNAGDPNSEKVLVDWILVELHAVPSGGSASDAGASTVLARKPAWLLRNGRIVDAQAFADNPKTRTEIAGCTGIVADDNCPEVEFRETTLDDGNDLYIVLRHRNHLDVISGMKAVDAGRGVYTHDFTQEPADLNKGYKSVSSTISMAVGDLNNDRNVNLTDFGRIYGPDHRATAKGYVISDLDFSDTVNLTDFGRKFGPNFRASASTVAPDTQ